MSLYQTPCADFKLGLWKSTNSVSNINTAKSLQKSRKQFTYRQKGPYQGDPVSCLVIHLYYKFIVKVIENGSPDGILQCFVHDPSKV